MYKSRYIMVQTTNLNWLAGFLNQQQCVLIIVMLQFYESHFLFLVASHSWHLVI